MLHTVYIGIGSNLDNPLEQVKTAIKELGLIDAITVDKVSNLYKSKPLKLTKKETIKHQEIQPDYINAVVCLKTSLEPLILLDALQELESKHKRVKKYRWAPRSLDLDVLLFDDLIMQTERLTIPHVELSNRDFVLYPLKDIAPEIVIPEQGALQKMLLDISDKELTLIE